MNAELISVLLVEDDPGDVLLIREAFADRKVGNVLSVVSDGVEAMQFIRGEGEYAGRERPDLVLLDLNLPRKSGAEVLAEIKGDPEPGDDPSRRADDLARRGRRAALLRAARERLHHQARRLRSLRRDRAADRRLLHRHRQAAAAPSRLSTPRRRAPARSTSGRLRRASVTARRARSRAAAGRAACRAPS